VALVVSELQIPILVVDLEAQQPVVFSVRSLQLALLEHLRPPPPSAPRPQQRLHSVGLLVVSVAQPSVVRLQSLKELLLYHFKQLSRKSLTQLVISK
jgi:hypothetical protein